jgi:hypothetical protein
MKKIAIAMSLAAGVLMAAAPAFPQNENSGQGQALITVLPANKKAPAPTLSPQDLAIKVNGQNSTITQLNPMGKEGNDLEVVVMLDSAARSSIGVQLDDISNFIKTLPQGAKAAVAWMINGTAQLGSPLTSNHQEALKGVHLPIGVPGGSASPYFCLSNLAKHWPSQDHAARRIVVMITDGVDNYEPYYDPQDPYVQAAVTDSVRAGLVVYPIYWENLGRFSRSWYANYDGQNLLNMVAEATGGYSYWQGFGNPVSFQPFFENLDRRLKNQYEMVFTAPLNNKSSEVANLHLKVTGVNGKVDAPHQVLVGRSGM